MQKDLYGRQADQLRKRFEARTDQDPDYWSFQHAGRRSGSHAFFQYPAMMVPELQGALLDDTRSIFPGAQKVFDPFAGSGTVMLEAIYRNMSFHGVDINPMAVLLCAVKASPPKPVDAKVAQAALRRSMTDRVATPPFKFANIEKWFHPEVISGLSVLRSTIGRIDDLDTRRFFWICLAETVRLVSNSRISTFKLHAYPVATLEARRPNPLSTFEMVTSANITHLEKHWARISERVDGAGPTIDIRQGSILDLDSASVDADILMTSPPYGDNKTTVPYGQHSYLPLQWIDGDDIPGGFDPSLLSSTSRIDTMSLGGSLRHADSHRAVLSEQSTAFEEFVRLIEDKPTLRKKVLSFTRDYREALTCASSQLRPGGLSLFTLGERRVGGQILPLTLITRELLVGMGHDHIVTIERRLPLSRKRMAGRNSEGSTMTTESILVTRKMAS